MLCFDDFKVFAGELLYRYLRVGVITREVLDVAMKKVLAASVIYLLS